MSATENETRATEVALAQEFDEAIGDACDRIAAILTPACPTPAFLVALREEVCRALAEPDSVPYPELADADEYWNATVRPQIQSLRENVATILQWLEQRVVRTMEVAETDLKVLVDTAAKEPGPDPHALRGMISEEIDKRCLDLHHQMADVLLVLAPAVPLPESRERAAEAIRSQATADVASLKEAYLREAGGDEAHQVFAEQQWSETFAERVAHRESMLASQAPWRHQELALVGFERARADVERMVEETAAHLQTPLRDMPALLLERYDANISTNA